MKIKLKPTQRAGGRSTQAMTLIEVLIATVGISILAATLYVALSQGFAVIQVARENLRATQILQEKMETMRVYNWDQINTPGFVPSSFTEPFYAVDSNNNGGFDYSGSVTITNAFPLGSASYSDDLRWVIVQVQWMSGNVMRRREMRTLVSQFGLHTYIY
jgi:type II secretory pathway pseudopilin PulG